MKTIKVEGKKLKLERTHAFTSLITRTRNVVGERI